MVLCRAVGLSASISFSAQCRSPNPRVAIRMFSLASEGSCESMELGELENPTRGFAPLLTQVTPGPRPPTNILAANATLPAPPRASAWDLSRSFYGYTYFQSTFGFQYWLHLSCVAFSTHPILVSAHEAMCSFLGGGLVACSSHQMNAMPEGHKARTSWAMAQDLQPL